MLRLTGILLISQHGVIGVQARCRTCSDEAIVSQSQSIEKGVVARLLHRCSLYFFLTKGSLSQPRLLQAGQSHQVFKHKTTKVSWAMNEPRYVGKSAYIQHTREASNAERGAVLSPTPFLTLARTRDLFPSDEGRGRDYVVYDDGDDCKRSAPTQRRLPTCILPRASFLKLPPLGQRLDPATPTHRPLLAAAIAPFQ